jgi:hypothetical protein
VGCVLDLAGLSPGMLRAAAHPALLNADVTALPLRDGVEVVRRQVQAVIAEGKAFITSGDLAAFICR